MRADVPPDLLRLVDAAGLEQETHIVVELRIRTEVIRDVGSRELLEYLRAIAFQSGLGAHPKRRASGKRQHVRQEVSRGVHQMYLSLAVVNANVNVHAEYQQRLRQHLHLVNQRLVMLVRRDLLVLPA